MIKPFKPGQVDILATCRTSPNCCLQRAAAKACIAKTEQIYCPSIVDTIRKAAIADGTDRQPVTRCIQRYRNAKLFKQFKRGQVDILPTTIAMSNGCLQYTVTKIGIAKAEKIYCPVSVETIRNAAIADGTDRQPVTRCIQRYRSAKLIKRFKRGQVDILATCIARPNHCLQRAAAKVRIAKAEQIYCPAKADIIGKSVIALGAYRQTVTSSVQRYRSAKFVKLL